MESDGARSSTGLLLGLSFIVYVVYKHYEPSSTFASFVLLVVLPGILTSQPANASFGTISTILNVYTLYWSSLLAFVVAYRLSPFHPLSAFPGPILCKISKFWHIYAVRRGKSHLYIRELHDKYGDVVRIGPNELSFRHEDAISPILASKDMPKGPYYNTRTHLDTHAIELDGVLDSVTHARRRKAWTKGTSPAAMKVYEEILRKYIHQLLGAFEKRGRDIDLAEWVDYITFDFVGELALSKQFGNLQAGSDHTGMMGRIREGVSIVWWMSHIPWILDFMALVAKFLRRATHVLDIEKEVASIVRHRLSMGADCRDLFHYLSDEDSMESVKPTVEDVAADGILALVAGSDTSAITLAHTFYFLLRNPQCMERLRKEIDARYPPGADTSIDFRAHADLPYLDACLNESMRLYPAVLSGMQRRVSTGTYGKMIGPYYVPDGSNVSAHLFSMQRDPRYFSPLPNDFWPDRFLTQDVYTLPSGDTITKDDLIHKKGVFIPFSIGARNCAGRVIAQTEMRAVLCAVLHKFEVSKAEGFDLDVWEKNLGEVFVTTHGPLMVNLKARW